MTLEKFHFTVDGKGYTLPKQVPSGALRKARSLSALDAAYTLLETCASPEVLAAHDKLEAKEGLAILNEWMQGLTAGESSSSPN